MSRTGTELAPALQPARSCALLVPSLPSPSSHCTPRGPGSANRTKTCLFPPERNKNPILTSYTHPGCTMPLLLRVACAPRSPCSGGHPSHPSLVLLLPRAGCGPRDLPASLGTTSSVGKASPGAIKRISLPCRQALFGADTARLLLFPQKARASPPPSWNAVLSPA